MVLILDIFETLLPKYLKFKKLQKSRIVQSYDILDDYNKFGNDGTSTMSLNYIVMKEPIISIDQF